MNDIKKIALAIGIISILISILMPIFSYRTWFEWWKVNDPKGIYNCFPLIKLAYYSKSILLYRTLNMFGSGTSQIKYDWWLYLFTGFMQGGAKGIVDGGYATPKSFCESLIPTDFPSQQLPYTVLAGTGLPASSTGWTGLTWPTDDNDWRILLSNWGDITWTVTPQEKFTPNNAGNSKWYTDKDNFLAVWGIPPDCPMMVGFMTNWDTFGGVKTYTKAIRPLLGQHTGIGSGGWWGFLQYGDDFGGNGLMEVNRIVWSDMLPPVVTNGNDKNNGCNKGAAVGGAIGGAGVGAMMGGEFAPLTAAIGALIGGLASAGANNCL